MEYCFIAFEIDSEQNLAALRRAFAAIKKAKEDGYLQAAPEWRSYFTEAQLQIFWSPSPEELTAHAEAWQSTPIATRLNDQSLQTPWDFDSMIEAIQNGEYTLIGIREMQEGRSRLEFNPEAYPYGGAEALRTLIQAFGHSILGWDDGTGYQEALPQSLAGWPARWADIAAQKGSPPEQRP